MEFKAFLEHSNSKNEPITIDNIDCYYIDIKFNAIVLVMKDGRKVLLRENEKNKKDVILQLKQYCINSVDERNEIIDYVNHLSHEELIHICKEKK